MSCGPNKFNSFIKPPNLIFTNSCKLHDKRYFNKNGKVRADLKFLKDMFNDIKNSNFNYFKKLILYLIAIIYFLFVFIFGFLFYGKNNFFTSP